MPLLCNRYDGSKDNDDLECVQVKLSDKSLEKDSPISSPQTVHKSHEENNIETMTILRDELVISNLGDGQSLKSQPQIDTSQKSSFGKNKFIIL